MEVTQKISWSSIGYARDDRAAKQPRRAWGRSVVYEPPTGGVRTQTHTLPARYLARLVGEGETETEAWAEIEVVLDMFGDYEDDDHFGKIRVGAAQIGIDVYTTTNPITGEDLKRVPLRRLVVDAVRQWSFNSDGSDVTEKQAEALLYSPRKTSVAGPERNWRVAAEAYQAAKLAGGKTGRAVAIALYGSASEKNQGKARRMIQRAKQHGFITEED